MNTKISISEIKKSKKYLRDMNKKIDRGQYFRVNLVSGFWCTNFKKKCF